MYHQSDTYPSAEMYVVGWKLRLLYVWYIYGS